VPTVPVRGAGARRVGLLGAPRGASVSLVRLRVFYFCSLGALGGTVPLLGARLDAAGFDGRQVGVLMAMLPLGRTLSGPAWGWLADRTGRAGLLVRLGGVVALCGLAGLLLARRWEFAVLAALVFSVGRAPFGPLVDALTLETLRAQGRDPRGYGAVRLWGSLGFLIVGVLAGTLVDAVGLDPLWLGVALSFVTLGLTFSMPDGRERARSAPVGPALRALAGAPGFVPFLAFAALHALTLSVYDTFFSIHVRALGLPAMTTSLALCTGIVAEVAVLRAGERLLARMSPGAWLVTAAVTAIPRWLGTAESTSAFALVALQTLHGVTFACFWMGAVQWMNERAPAEVRASAQSLLSSASYGVGALAGALLAGELRARAGMAATFQVLAAISVVATGCAVVAWHAGRGLGVGGSTPRVSA
jgi:PPP family 3-phenylpropionic acid transporter